MDTMTTNLDAEIEQLEARWQHVETFRHVDGSATVIVLDDDPATHPRLDCDNFTHLVMEHRNYRALDESDAGIDEARERWGEESPLVERYVRIFRPDIAAYVPRWEVSGYSQGDWAYGYGYVLAADFIEGSAGRELNESERAAALIALEQDVSIYEEYFRGDVYGAIHLEQGDPIVIYGDHGAYVDDYEVRDEACWGFLAYPRLEDIVEEMSSVPLA